jgi:PleD family two-component response regulator
LLSNPIGQVAHRLASLAAPEKHFPVLLWRSRGAGSTAHRIGVVDDDRFNRSMAVNLLESQGCDVKSVELAHEAPSFAETKNSSK